MSEGQRIERRSRSGRRAAAALAGLLALGAASACTAASGSGSSSQASSTDPSSSASSSGSSSASARPTPSVSVVSNLKRTAGVKVDKVVTLTAKGGTFTTVSVRSGAGAVPGALSADKTSWTSRQLLEPSRRYQVTTVAVDKDGLKATEHTSFRTQDLSLDQQTFPSFAPLAGQTVGVGMPVIVRFDVPIADKPAIEKHLTVTNTAHQKGAWHWISDSEVHWRPVHYWKPGTDVTVKADVNSIPAGNGIYGQISRTSTFHIGDAMVSKVNARTDHMQVFRNGSLLRTIPITTGKPGFVTRSGVKVIVEKFRHKRMDSETIGIAHNSVNGYNLDDVEYAMRVTYTGEFLHAAPWSVGSQGSTNVSHGCTGMSTSNAAWLYGISKPGDVVEYTGTDRPMTLTNGYGDWNETFAQYQQGSALG